MTARDTHLSIWEAVFDHRNDNVGRPSEHQAFIRRCIEELDVSGFSWSKDSFEDILLHVGQQNAGVDSIDVQKTTSAPHCDSPHPDNTCGTTLSPRTAASISTSNLSSLMDLPHEVLDQIVELVHSQTGSETEDLNKLRKARGRLIYEETDEVRLYGRRFYETCLHSEEPILNTFQSLASINRTLFNFCVPKLWKALKFPTPLSVPLELWTKSVLPKHGSQVQHLTVGISNEVLSVPWHHSFQIDFHDNTFSTMTMPTNRQPNISPQGFISLVEQCPNLVELVLQFPEVDWDCNLALSSDDEVHHRLTHSYVLSLSPLLSGLVTLRHLGLEDSSSTCRAQQVIIPLIVNLPLLESLSCKGFVRGLDDYNAKSLAIHVSQLQHLSRIDLETVSFPDRFWFKAHWSCLLTDVSLICTELSLTDLSSMIHEFAPNITKLACAFYEGTREFEAYQRSLVNPPFNLPQLVDLTLILEGHTTEYIAAFMGCKALRRLTYQCSDGPPRFLTFLDILSNDFWPSLKFIKLRKDDHFPTCPEEFEKLKQHCKRAQIQLVVESVIEDDE